MNGNDWTSVIYSLGVLLAFAVLVAGIVEGSRWLAHQWGLWRVRREFRRATREWAQEQAAWRKTW